MPEPEQTDQQLNTLRTIAEAQLLTAQPLSREQWLSLEKSGLPTEELSRLIEAETAIPAEGDSDLDILMKYPGNTINALRESMRASLASGGLPAIRNRVYLACQHTRPGRVNASPSPKFVSETLLALTRHWQEHGQPDEEVLKTWGHELADLIGHFPTLTLTSRRMLVTVMEEHAELFPRFPDLIARNKQTEVIGTLALIAGPALLPRVWAIADRLGLSGETTLLRRLLDETDLRPGTLALSAQMVPLTLSFEQALTWSAEHRDGLHWTVRENLSVDQATEIMFSVQDAPWKGLDTRGLKVKQDDSEHWEEDENAAEQLARRAAVLARIRRWPCPWLADRTAEYPKKLIGWLATQAPLDLLSLSTMSRSLRGKFTRDEWSGMRAAIGTLRQSAADHPTPGEAHAEKLPQTP